MLCYMLTTEPCEQPFLAAPAPGHYLTGIMKDSGDTIGIVETQANRLSGLHVDLLWICHDHLKRGCVQDYVRLAV